ncbi:MAG: polymer-forming cytoskeletal protein [Deltaproteobacteria bacterium]|nr:polymer-forming cytoskeletal protein [Deltaproteobacteria bacterium]
MAAFWKKKELDSSVECVDESALDANQPEEYTAGQESQVVADSEASEREDVEAEISRRFGTVSMVLGAGTVIEGKLNFDSHVRIEGRLGGEIFSAKAVIVAPGGEVEATIETEHLLVLGRVKGDVLATQSIEIYPGGRLDGDVSAPNLVIKEGAVFNGQCSMPDRSTKRTHP